MQTTTRLHTLLRSFRDEAGAQTCAVVSLDAGTRVDVGRPTTLSADNLAAGKPAGIDLLHPERLSSRFLFATAGGYAVAAEFESEEAAENAQWQFDALVHAITMLVSDPPP